jgi:hypothetical protein
MFADTEAFSIDGIGAFIDSLLHSESCNIDPQESEGKRQ